MATIQVELGLLHTGALKVDSATEIQTNPTAAFSFSMLTGVLREVGSLITALDSIEVRADEKYTSDIYAALAGLGADTFGVAKLGSNDWRHVNVEGLWVKIPTGGGYVITDTSGGPYNFGRVWGTGETEMFRSYLVIYVHQP